MAPQAAGWAERACPITPIPLQGADPSAPVSHTTQNDTERQRVCSPVFTRGGEKKKSTFPGVNSSFPRFYVLSDGKRQIPARPLGRPEAHGEGHGGALVASGGARGVPSGCPPPQDSVRPATERRSLSLLLEQPTNRFGRCSGFEERVGNPQPPGPAPASTKPPRGALSARLAPLRGHLSRAAKKIPSCSPCNPRFSFTIIQSGFISVFFRRLLFQGCYSILIH